MPQLPLFEQPSAGGSTSRTLVVRAPAGRPLGKRERAVNRLLKRVEALRARLDRERTRLEEALAFQATQVRPRRERITALRIEAVRRLRPFLDNRRLTQADRRALRAILRDQLDEVLSATLSPPEDFQALFERLRGVSYAQFVEEELAEGRRAMAVVFEEMGLDIDVPNLRPGMSEDELAASVAEAAERMRQLEAERAARASSRPKTKRMQSEEARAQRFEQIRKLGVGTLYKRLVKVLHPDLERDPEAHARKVALMQEVTTAYKRNDLHMLMRLEREVSGHAGDAAQVADETLDAYVELLRRQASELEVECAGLRLDPRYADLWSRHQLFGMPMLIDGPAEAERLELVIRSLEASLARMADGRALEEVRDLVRDYRSATRRGRR